MALLHQELAEGKINKALIQKPWVYGDQIRGLCSRRTKFSTGPSLILRSCIFVRNTTDDFQLSESCSRDVTTARIQH